MAKRASFTSESQAPEVDALLCWWHYASLFTHVNSSVWPLDRRGSKVPVLYVQKFGSTSFEADARYRTDHPCFTWNYADGVERCWQWGSGTIQVEKYRPRIRV